MDGDPFLPSAVVITFTRHGAQWNRHRAGSEFAALSIGDDKRAQVSLQPIAAQMAVRTSGIPFLEDKERSPQKTNECVKMVQPFLEIKCSWFP